MEKDTEQKKVSLIRNGETVHKTMEAPKEMVDEPKVIFRAISDRDVMNIKNSDIDKIVAEISGYDLQINFNMEFINSMEDIEIVINGISQLFRDAIMDQLLSHSNKQNQE